MVSCDVIDLKCFFVNEIIGSIALTTILMVLIYFVIAARLKFGFETTMYGAIPVVLILGLMFSGFQPIYAFLTFLAAMLVSIIIQRFIGNR